MWRCDRGQTAAEYLGALLVVSVIVAAVSMTTAGEAIAREMTRLVCEIGGGNCTPEAPAPSRPPAPPANHPGDETSAISSHGAELKTDQCPGASLSSVVNGAPGVPDDYDVYLASPYGECTARARLVGIDKNGTVVSTPYTQLLGGREDVLSAQGVYRCYIEFGVRRRDGSFYTQKIRPTDPEVQGCPR